MKYYHSEFSPSDTEFLYQQIEELKGYLSEEALFFMEEKTMIKGKSRIVLKVKEGEILFQVDSTAPDLFLATKAAKDKIIEMILLKKAKPLVANPYKAVVVYN